MNSIQKQKQSDLSFGVVGYDFLKRWVIEFKAVFGKPYLSSAGDEMAAKELEKYGKETDLFYTIFGAWNNPDGFACKKSRTITGFRENYNEICAELDAAKPNPAPQFRENDKQAYKESVLNQSFDTLPLPHGMKEKLHEIQLQGYDKALAENKRWHEDREYREAQQSDYARRMQNYFTDKRREDEIYRSFNKGIETDVRDYAERFANVFPDSYYAELHAWNNPDSTYAKTYADKNPETEFSKRYKARHKREYPETDYMHAND